MHYKTMILALLEQHTEWFDQLRREQSLLATLEKLARQLKTRHEFWQEACSHTHPDNDPIQRSSMALELALEELEAQWGPEIPPQEAEPLSLDAAMTYLRQASPPA